jgi:hypothetical protein
MRSRSDFALMRVTDWAGYPVPVSPMFLDAIDVALRAR